ncbi:hypothetical protein HPB50_013504 [Hyalomma asiaticum]|uniref:Uncharacterized protein n=1 Tax=Hyalomma asiaticum TaxID=266040 RepID=A0ACB7THK5_HYAAI|nr:hypothetical protein HPB50_013504 [Hyalomma asiaticum]
MRSTHGSNRVGRALLGLRTFSRASPEILILANLHQHQRIPDVSRNLGTPSSAALARCRCAMKKTVAGTEITPKEFEASEWLTQVNKSREARTSKGTTIPLASGTQDGRSSSHKTSIAPNDGTSATDRSLTPRQRGRRLALNSVASKQPRLPSDALKLIVRPKGGLLLSKITNFQLFEAVCTAANFPKASIRGEDLIQVNSTQNTFAYCTPAVERAERVLRLKELVIEAHKYEISTTKVSKKNYKILVTLPSLTFAVWGTPPPCCMLTFKEPRVPMWIYLCNACHRCNLYKKKFEVCYRCSELGHRADVCASTVIKCRGCAIPDPPSDHVCIPTCRPCGKQHITGDSRFPTTWGRLFPQVITAIVQLESAYLCYYSARSTGGEVTWIHSFRNSFCGAAVTQLVQRVTTIEQRIESRAFSHPPSMTQTSTSTPMDTDSVAGTALKRKAYEVGGTQPGDTQAQIERLTSALTMSETLTDQRFAALEATMEKHFQTLAAQFTQQLDSLSKALDARCKSYDAALGPASSSVTGGTNSHPNHGGPLAGVGVARDTTPDLTFVGRGVNATWCNTLETFGSDHYVLEIVIQEHTRERLRSARLTDWDRFRTHRQASETCQCITDISTWSATLLQHVADATTEVEVEKSVPSCDRHYAKLRARKRKLETLLQTRKWDKDKRRLLARVHTHIENCAIDLTHIPTAQRLSFCIPPLPEHMHPEHHADCRTDRARQQQKRFASRSDVTYTDASRHPHRSTMVAVALASHRGWSTACSVVHSDDITVAEEVAIALAMTDRTTKVIVSDSQLAIRNFDAGRISTQAYSIIKDHTPPTSPRHLIWAPAHESLSGNVQAHTLARDLNCRAEFLTPHTSHSSPSQTCEKLTPLVTYTDILQHYRLRRLHFPPAHKDLPRRDAVLWRKLQTGAFPNPWLYSKVYPHLVTPHCRYCSQSATLIHMAWTCPQYADASHTEDRWEFLLRTTDPAQQRRVISRAFEAAASQGIPADLL